MSKFRIDIDEVGEFDVSVNGVVVGRAVSAGLGTMDITMFNTDEGRAATELIRSSALDGMSLSFSDPIEDNPLLSKLLKKDLPNA